MRLWLLAMSALGLLSCAKDQPPRVYAPPPLIYTLNYNETITFNEANNLHSLEGLQRTLQTFEVENSCQKAISNLFVDLKEYQQAGYSLAYLEITPVRFLGGYGAPCYEVCLWVDRDHPIRRGPGCRSLIKWMNEHDARVFQRRVD